MSSVFPLGPFLPLYISSILTQQMPPRRDPSRSGSGSGIPGLEQLLQNQNQLMQLLMQNMNTNNNNNNAPPSPPPPPPVDSLTRFLRLNPPLFSSSPELIVADR